MSHDDWQSIIVAMAGRSGRTRENVIPNETAEQIEQLTGTKLPPERRRFSSQWPIVKFEPGLTDDEVTAVEGRYGFRFPPDLREFLQTAMPIGEKFPNWRSHDEAEMREWLAMPAEGVCFDVEHNNFWLPEWGDRSEALDDALRVCRELLAKAPTLIPIYAHRFIPDDPHASGNPVLSVHQTDIIYYGADLADYLRHEFGLPLSAGTPRDIRPIRFWDIDRFQDVRWTDGGCVTDPRTLPEDLTNRE